MSTTYIDNQWMITQLAAGDYIVHRTTDWLGKDGQLVTNRDQARHFKSLKGATLSLRRFVYLQQISQRFGLIPAYS